MEGEMMPKKYLWKIECYEDEKEKIVNKIRSEGIKINDIECFGEICHIYFEATIKDAMKFKGISRGEWLGLFRVIRRGG
jgi:hypothetical protein